ncbi:MAG: hypothetical protein ACW97P_13665, partial [Candidatus Hodarchaeales archaeon]
MTKHGYFTCRWETFFKVFSFVFIQFDKKIKTGSKYYKTWCMVNGWQKPSRGAKMSPRIFLNKIFK